MESILSNITLAITTFAITNIDDLLILTIYFSIPNVKVKQIIIGQYLGVIALILISLSGIILGDILDPKYIHLLGVVPIFLGLKDFYQLYKGDKENIDEQSNIQADGSLTFMKVAIVTFANGGDNIGVYTPLFASIKSDMILLYVVNFILMVGVWCILGNYAVRHQAVKKIFSRYGKVILPFFLVILGVWILFE